MHRIKWPGTAARVAAVLLLSVATGTAAGLDAPAGAPRAQKGDIVALEITAATETGRVFFTTSSEVAGDDRRPKVSWYQPQGSHRPEIVVAGEDAPIQGIQEAVVGMAAGDTKRVTVPPEKAFGIPDPKRIVQMPLVKRMPRTMALTPDDFFGRFQKFPMVGNEVPMTPYFDGRIAEVTETRVVVEAVPGARTVFPEAFGELEVRFEEEEVVMTARPELGKVVTADGRRGRVVSADSENFVVDFNHPMAGQAVVAELEAVSVTPASAMAARPVGWIEDHARALEAAKKQEKNLVLVLYADWCQWCRKTLEVTMEDPRVKLLDDRFLFAKVNSDKLAAIKEHYRQQGFPLIVILDPRGAELERIDGYVDAKGLLEVLHRHGGTRADTAMSPRPSKTALP